MKMELIASLLHSPRVLFLDEPTIGLDVVAQREIRDFLKRYNKENKTTIMLTSHYLRDVEALCERVIVLHKGEIVFDGNMSELAKKYSDDKLLSVAFPRSVPKELNIFGNVISKDEEKVMPRVKREKVAEVAKTLLEKYGVKDITVEEIPIEDVIRELFLALGREEDGEI